MSSDLSYVNKSSQWGWSRCGSWRPPPASVDWHTAGSCTEMRADMQMCKKTHLFHLRLSQKKKSSDRSNLFSWMISKDRCSKLTLFDVLSVNTAQKKQWPLHSSIHNISLQTLHYHRQPVLKINTLLWKTGLKCAALQVCTFFILCSLHLQLNNKYTTFKKASASFPTYYLYACTAVAQRTAGEFGGGAPFWVGGPVQQNMS